MNDSCLFMVLCALDGIVSNGITNSRYRLIAGVCCHGVILSPTNSSTHFVIHTHLLAGDNRSDRVAMPVQGNSV